MKQAKSGSYQPRLAMIFSLLAILLSGVSNQAQASNPFADCANGGGQDIDHTMYGQFDGMTCRPLMESIKSISIKPSNVIMSQKPTQIQISVVSTLSPSSEWMPQGDLVNNCGECGAGDGVFPTLELKTNQFTVLNNLNSKQKAAASNTVTATSKPATVTHSATKPTTSSRPSKATRGPLPCSAAVEQQLLNIVKYIQINADEDQMYQGELQQAQQNIGQDNATGNYLGAASDRQNVIAFQMKINANNAEDSIKRQQFATLTSQCVNTIVPAP